MNTQRLTVVYATDGGFWVHTYVSIYSLLANNRDIAFDIRILSEEPNTGFFENTAHLTSVHPDVTVEWIPVSTDMFVDAPATARITMATYYRLLLDQLLPESVERLLYIDGDTIIRDSIQPLLDVDISDVILAGVADYIPEFKQPPMIAHPLRLGMPAGSLYFNAGMLYINLQRWRETRTGERAIQYVLEHLGDPVMLEHRDQDTLNMVCLGQWQPLGPRFNYAEWSMDSQRLRDTRTANAPGATIPAAGPTIAHYTGRTKPWHGGSPHPFAREYWTYRMQTPYADRRAYLRSQVLGLPGTVRHAIVRTIRRTPGGNSMLRMVSVRLQKA